jgi:methionyl-tRNA formyltransferase
MAGKEPGEIVEIKEGEVVVALDGGALGIGKVRDVAGAKMGAGEYAQGAGLKVGMKFGS